MPDPRESEEFERIVSELRATDPQLGRSWWRRNAMLLAGLALCAVAVTLVAVGGVEGVVIAVLPWLLGLFLVIRSRSGR